MAQSPPFSGMMEPMNSQEIIDRLRENEAALRARGVAHAALFGSRARGDERPDSDTDIMVELDPEAHVTLFDYVGLKEYVASLFEGSVDVVNREGLKPYVRPTATSDAIYAF
jgi:predicted nucleotidyltransferase